MRVRSPTNSTQHSLEKKCPSSYYTSLGKCSAATTLLLGFDCCDLFITAAFQLKTTHNISRDTPITYTNHLQSIDLPTSQNIRCRLRNEIHLLTSFTHLSPDSLEHPARKIPRTQTHAVTVFLDSLYSNEKQHHHLASLSVYTLNGIEQSNRQHSNPLFEYAGHIGL